MKRVLSIVAVGAAVGLVAAGGAGAANITVHAIPTAGAKPTQVVAGPDGRLWFTETGAQHEIGRFDPSSGQFAPIALANIDEATTDEGTVALAPSTNGSVWALDDGGQELYRVSAAGVPTQVMPYGPQGTDGTSSYDDALAMPDALAAAAGGGVWTLFGNHNPSLPGNAYNGATIVRDDGSPHLITNQTYDDPHPGALNPADGSLWIADDAYVTRVGADGAVTRIPTGLDASYGTTSAVIGPDGALWFGASMSGSWLFGAHAGVIGHVVGGQVQLIRLNSAASPTALRVGPDGALWWSESVVASTTAATGAIGRLDPATGAVQEGSLGAYVPAGIAFAGNGTLWFVDRDANAIGQVALDGALFPAPAAPAPPAASPAPTPPAPPKAVAKPAAPHATITSKTLRVKAHRVTLTVSCPTTMKATCHGSISLRTAAKLKVKGHKKKALVTLTSRASYTVKRGHHATVRLTLTRTARSIVRHGHSLKVDVLLTPTGAKKPATTALATLHG